jgi:cytochrome d ubiquinol oxidase subunit II
MPASTRRRCGRRARPRSGAPEPASEEPRHGPRDLWFCLIAVLWAATSCSRASTSASACCCRSCRATSASASTMFETIGPVWDGNEVWLVVAGGATFAAFPAWYATMFSASTSRCCSSSCADRPRASPSSGARSSDGARWRAPGVGEHGRQRRRRVRLGRRAREPRARRAARLERRLHRRLLDLFSAYTVLAGAAVVALFAFHGATFLTLRTSGDCASARRGDARLAVPAASLGGASWPGRSPSPSTATTASLFPPCDPARDRDRRARGRRRARARAGAAAGRSR